MAFIGEVVPFNDPARKIRAIPNLELILLEFLKKGPYLNGEELSLFEEDLAKYLNVKYVYGVSSGTAALEIAMCALELVDDSEILVAANAGGYSSIAAVKSRLRPTYCEVNTNGLIDFETFERSKNSKTKAIVLTHLYGQTVDVEAIYQYCSDNDIYVIEDCAQAIGARTNGRRVGSIGDISTFSFYPTKNLGTTGDAGAICTNNYTLAKKITMLKQYGWSERYFAQVSNGSNFRMDDLHALILRKQLSGVDALNSERRKIWSGYQKILETGGYELLGKNNDTFVAHLAVFSVANRNEFTKHLESLGIGWAIHYPFPDYSQDAFSKYRTKKLSITETLSASVVSIPLFSELSKKEISSVENALDLWCKKYSNDN